MGALQKGLPLLSALPKDWPIIALNIKDCFFSIPLCVQDRERFAFTLPSINHECPDVRYQWKVLPQGMANSPTICQLFVASALEPVRSRFPQVRIFHFMDDILLTASFQGVLLEAFSMVTALLSERGLIIAPKKVQQSDIIKFLGAVISPQTIRPQKIHIRTQHLKTLNDFQKLLGNINWIRGYLNVPQADLLPLFSILESNPDVNSHRDLTPAAACSLQKIGAAMSDAQLTR